MDGLAPRGPTPASGKPTREVQPQTRDRDASVAAAIGTITQQTAAIRIATATLRLTPPAILDSVAPGRFHESQWRLSWPAGAAEIISLFLRQLLPFAPGYACAKPRAVAQGPAALSKITMPRALPPFLGLPAGWRKSISPRRSADIPHGASSIPATRSR
jgi:hypothetical protein